MEIQKVVKNKKRKGLMRVSKVPVRIVAPNKQLEKLRMAIITMAMYESQKISNKAIIQFITRRKNGIGNLKQKKDPTKSAAYDTLVYDDLKCERKWLPSSAYATGLRRAVAEAKKGYSGILCGKNGIPSFKTPFFILRSGSIKVSKCGDQYEIDVSGYGLNTMGVTQASLKELVDCKISKKEERLNKAKENQKNGKATKNELKFLARAEPDLKDWRDIKEALESGKRDVIVEMGNAFVLRSNLSKKDDDGDKSARSILDKIIQNPAILGDSKMELKDGKLFVLVAYEMAQKKESFKPEGVMGIDLGVNSPVVCAFNDSKERARIGDRDVINHYRNKFRAVRRREQVDAGIHTKTRMWEMSESEVNWSRTYYHCMTRDVVNLAIKGGYGVIHAEMLSGLRDKMSESSKLIFCPGMFLSMLKNICDEYGIKLVLGNPKNSSLRCHNCGHTSKFNRNRCPKCGGEKHDKKPYCKDCGEKIYAKDFKCVKCGKTCDADYNAARNISEWKKREIERGYSSDDSDEIDSEMIAEAEIPEEKLLCAV